MRFLNSIRKSEVLAILLCASSLAAQDTLHPGVFKGTWMGATGDGEVTITLKPDGQGGMGADVALIVAGEPVRCSVNSVKVSGVNLEDDLRFRCSGDETAVGVQGNAQGRDARRDL